jgi:hypothetical protein
VFTATFSNILVLGVEEAASMNENLLCKVSSMINTQNTKLYDYFDQAADIIDCRCINYVFANCVSEN